MPTPLSGLSVSRPDCLPSHSLPLCDVQQHLELLCPQVNPLPSLPNHVPLCDTHSWAFSFSSWASNATCPLMTPDVLSSAWTSSLNVFLARPPVYLTSTWACERYLEPNTASLDPWLPSTRLALGRPSPSQKMATLLLAQATDFGPTRDLSCCSLADSSLQSTFGTQH